MSNLIKTIIRRFLCEHKNLEFIDQIITKRQWEGSGANPTLEEDKYESEILYLKRNSRCKNCGKNISFIHRK